MERAGSVALSGERKGVRIELANMVAVQCLHDADPGDIVGPLFSATRIRAFICGPPLGSLVLGLRKLRDVSCRRPAA